MVGCLSVQSPPGKVPLFLPQSSAAVFWSKSGGNHISLVSWFLDTTDRFLDRFLDTSMKSIVAFNFRVDLLSDFVNT